MPRPGSLLGGVDIKHLYLNPGDKAFETLEAAEKAGAPIVKYGAFINSVVDCLIIAFAIFMAIKVMNRLKRAEAAAPTAEPATRECPHCLSTIPLKATRCPHCASQLQ